MALKRWGRPRGSVHDLARAIAYGDGGCHLLLVSDASLMVLQNLAALDVTFEARWADEYVPGGFVPISPESANYDAWVNLVDRLQVEVQPVTCDITEALAALTTQVEAINTTLAALTIPPPDLTTTNQKLDALAAAFRDQQLCCGGVADLPYWPPDPDPAENPETSTFCDRSWSFAKNWNDAAQELYRKLFAGETIGVGILALILAFLFPPVTILLAVMTLASQLVLDLSEEDLYDDLDALVGDIACAIYSSIDSAAAKSAIDQILAEATWPTGMPLLGITLLQNLVTVEALNQIYLETYAIRADSSGSDCQTCAPQGDVLLETAHGSPYNVLLVGDSVTQFTSEDASYGWENSNSGAQPSTKFKFTPTSNVASVSLSYEVYTVRPSSDTSVYRPRLALASNEGSLQWNPGWQAGTNQEWVPMSYAITLSSGFTSGTQYMFSISSWASKMHRVRDILLVKTG